MQPKPGKQQLAKDLYFQTDKTQQQIADILDVNRRTVYLWIKNGRWEEMKIALRQAPGMILQTIYNHIDQINLKIKGRDPDDRCPTMEEVNKMQKLLKMTNNIAAQHTGAYMEAYEELLKFIIKKDRALGRQVAIIANEYVSGFLKRKEFYLDEQEMENIEQVTKNLEEDKQEQKETNNIIPLFPSQKSHQEDGKGMTSPSPSECLPEHERSSGERSTAGEDTPSPSECLPEHERSSRVRPTTGEDTQAPDLQDGKCTPSPSPLECLPEHERSSWERSTPDMPNSQLQIPNSGQKEPVILSPANAILCDTDATFTSPSDICPKPAITKDSTEDIHTPISHNTPKENVPENEILHIHDEQTVNCELPTKDCQLPTENCQLTAAYYATLPPSERPSPFREGNILWVNDIEDVNDDERKMSDIVRRYPDMDPYINKKPYQDPFKKTEEEKAKMAKAIADRKAITDKFMNENIFREYKDVATVMSTNIYDKVNVKGKDINKMWFQYNLKQMELPSDKRELLTETEFLRRHSIEATLKYMRRAG